MIPAPDTLKPRCRTSSKREVAARAARAAGKAVTTLTVPSWLDRARRQCVKSVQHSWTKPCMAPPPPSPYPHTPCMYRDDRRVFYKPCDSCSCRLLKLLIDCTFSSILLCKTSRLCVSASLLVVCVCGCVCWCMYVRACVSAFVYVCV